jgi:DNA-binding LytR/AlgR family response regulator
VSITIQRPTMLYFVQPSYLPDWQSSSFFKITELFNTALDVNIAAIIPVIYRIIRSDKTINKKVVEYEKKDKIHQSLQNAFIYLKVEKTIIKIALKDIVYIESLKNYIKVNMINETIVAYKSLSALDKELPTTKFLRIHRSFIIRIDYLDSFSPFKVVVNKKELPVGRKYKADVKRILNYK